MNWWDSFFDEDYAERFLPKQVEAQTRHLIQQLEVEPGARVFDQCCGQGRFSRVLAELGYRPVGVDACPEYVQAAQTSCPGGEFFCGDASRFEAHPVCDGAFNVYSSFGYSDDDRFHLEMLKRVSASLRPGGRFVLETINFANVIANFQTTLRNEFPDGMVVERHSRLDWPRGLLTQEWVFRGPGQPERRRATATRMLLPRELADMLRAAELEPLRLMGDLAGEEFCRDGPRLVWLARRR